MTAAPISSVPSPSADLRMVAVHAHPDDESSKGAGTMARYVREGVSVTVITCTGGERGDILNPRMREDEEALADLPAVRRREMARAQEVLGIDHEWLGFVDSGLPEGDPLPELPEGCFALQDPEEAARPLVQALRRLRPQVLTTYDENGGYPHPDHIQTHRVTMAAYRLASDPQFAPELGEPWQVQKVYYCNGFSRQKFAAVARHLRAHHQPSEDIEQMLQRFDETRDRMLTTFIDVTEVMEIRDEALRAHATQVDPEGLFFAIDNEIMRAAWPTEDFELRYSLVGVTLPENDLFAGIR